MDGVTLRRATAADVHWLELWDDDPDVVAATTDDTEATVAFSNADWAAEVAAQIDGIAEYYIAEADGRPIGAMQIIDPHAEPTHYWGAVAPNLRAIDIWIGSSSDRSRGLGSAMMRLALERCFADPRVTGIVIDPLASNARAHRFYRRLGFEPVERRTFGNDDCLVHELKRERWRR